MQETNFYKVKVLALIEDPDSGKIKKERSVYLVEATGATEAEARTVKYIRETAMFNYDFDITAVVLEKLEGIILDTDD